MLPECQLDVSFTHCQLMYRSSRLAGLTRQKHAAGSEQSTAGCPQRAGVHKLIGDRAEELVRPTLWVGVADGSASCVLCCVSKKDLKIMNKTLRL